MRRSTTTSARRKRRQRECFYPAEVEEVIYQMLEALECAVIGVPHEKWGETVKAVVVLKPGESLTEQEVIDYCSKLSLPTKNRQSSNLSTHYRAMHPENC